MAVTVRLVPLILLLLHSAASTDYPEMGVPAKIIGGRTAAEGQFPFVGSLRRTPDTHPCGVSLVSNDTGVTAAHCFNNKTNPPIRVVFGDVQLFEKTSFHQESEFTVTKHPGYDDNNKANDIALIHLNTPIMPFNQNIKSIVLSDSSNEAPTFYDCIIIGWGDTNVNADQPSDGLNFAPVEIYDYSKCSTNRDEATTLCAGSDAPSHSYKGDSGGPLACKRKLGSNAYELVGVISCGPTECPIGKPATYTRVSAFREWIENGATLIHGTQTPIVICFVVLMVTFHF